MIIGINGKIGSGKDTTAEIINKLLITNGKEPFENKKFAGKLKTIASILTEIPVENFEDQEFKKLDMNPEWEMTYREFLQRLGTEAMRNGLHANVWVNALFVDYKCPECNSIPNQVCFGHRNPNWIITDMRFPNEMKAVVEKGGLTIRVTRPGTATGTHPSETALDNAEFDYKIINDGTLEDLVEKVREVLTKENIL